MLESLKQLLTCEVSWHKAEKRARERPKQSAATGEAEGDAHDGGDVQQKLDLHPIAKPF